MSKETDLDKEFDVGKFYVITSTDQAYVGLCDDIRLAQAIAEEYPDRTWEVSAYPFLEKAMNHTTAIGMAFGVRPSLISSNFDEDISATNKRFVHQDTLHRARLIKEGNK